MDARAKKIQQQKRQRRNEDALHEALTKSYNLGVKHMREALGIALHIGDKRMERVNEWHKKILSEWDGRELVKFAHELDKVFLKLDKR